MSPCDSKKCTTNESDKVSILKLKRLLFKLNHICSREEEPRSKNRKTLETLNKPKAWWEKEDSGDVMVSCDEREWRQDNYQSVAYLLQNTRQIR